MGRFKQEESFDLTVRLRQIELLGESEIVQPRTAPDDLIEEMFPPLLDVVRREGRMYVAGREPHFRTVTLRQPVRSERVTAS